MKRDKLTKKKSEKKKKRWGCFGVGGRGRALLLLTEVTCQRVGDTVPYLLAAVS